MAYATTITIATGNKVSMNYQSQDVSVSLTYQLERDDTDLLALVDRKAAEVEKAHRTAWKRIRDERLAEQAASNGNGANAASAAPSANGAANSNGTESAKTATEVAPNGLASSGEQANGTGGGETPALAAKIPRASRNGTKAAEEPPPPPETTQVDTETGPATPQEAAPTMQAPRESSARTGATPSHRPVTETQLRAIGSLSGRLGLSEEELNRRTDIRHGKKSVRELTEPQATTLILELQRNAPVIAAGKSAAAGQGNGSGAVPHADNTQGGNGHGNKTRRAAARS